MAKNVEETLKTIEKNKKVIRLLKGLKDQLPHEEQYWRVMQRSIDAVTERYGFRRIETPILENTNVFAKTIGKNHPLVSNELYSFEDDSNSYAFRPELTPAIVRSYLEHGYFNEKLQPFKLFAQGPVFRRHHSNPNKFKQFHEYSCEAIGAVDPIIDAQLILIGYSILKELGLPVSVQVNSWGVVDEYKPELVQYLRQKRKMLPEEMHPFISKEPWKVFCFDDEACVAVRMDAPQTVDHLSDASREHFIKVLEYLDELDIPYVLNPFLRRDRDYYSSTVFEFVDDSQDDTVYSYGGGGRYDSLINEFSGLEVPAAGFSFNLDRLVRSMIDRKIKHERPRVFLAQLGDRAKKKALVLFEELRREGIDVVEDFSKDSLKMQLERASKTDIKLVLVLGQKEVLDDTVIIRDMEGGIQETIDSSKVVGELRKRLKTVA